MSNVQQVTSIECRIQFNQIERPTSEPREITLNFNTFEGMVERIWKEKKRRKIADRATSAQYRLVLTAHGHAKIASTDPLDAHATKEYFAEEISGEWKDFGWNK